MTDSRVEAEPSDLRLKAAIVAVVEHAEESGECRECGAEVCRGSPHEIDPPCRIGTLKHAALSRSLSQGAPEPNELPHKGGL